MWQSGSAGKGRIEQVVVDSELSPHPCSGTAPRSRMATPFLTTRSKDDAGRRCSSYHLSTGLHRGYRRAKKLGSSRAESRLWPVSTGASTGTDRSIRPLGSGRVENRPSSTMTLRGSRSTKSVRDRSRRVEQPRNRRSATLRTSRSGVVPGLRCAGVASRERPQPLPTVCGHTTLHPGCPK